MAVFPALNLPSALSCSLSKDRQEQKRKYHYEIKLMVILIIELDKLVLGFIVHYPLRMEQGQALWPPKFYICPIYGILCPGFVETRSV